MARADAADELIYAVMSGLTRARQDRRETPVPGHDHAAEHEASSLTTASWPRGTSPTPSTTLS